MIFWAFFQISKSSIFTAVNPFADDPVDAIGSIAVQVALAVSLLTLARAVRVSQASTVSLYKSRLIVRGNSVALSAIAITLSADLYTELQHPTWNESIWGLGLIVGLGAVALITGVAALAAINAARRLKTGQGLEQQATDEAGSLDEALADLWALARTILSWFSRQLPWLGCPLRWVDSVGNRLFEWMMNWPWISPRSHPWRFCAAVALALGVTLAAVHRVEEGPPVSLALALLVSMIFIGVEFAAALIGYLALGGFLGLRPPLRSHR